MVSRHAPLAFAAVLATASPAPAAERPLVLSTLPFDNADEQAAVFSTLARQLGSRLGRPVTFAAGQSYDDVIAKLGKGEVDLAFIGAAAYVRARKLGSARVILKTVRHRTTGYHGVIVVKKGAPLTALAGLRGKRLAFVDRSSSAGYVFPRLLLKAAGVDPERDVSVSYLGSHRAVVEAVASGKVDAGACFEGAEDSLKDPGAVVPIARTDRIPGDPIVVRPGLGPELVKALRSALVDLVADAEARAFFTFAEIDGFVPAVDSDYDGVASLMQGP